MSDAMEPVVSGGLPAFVARNADGLLGLTLRSAIASIPVVGGGVSLLVEARLSARLTERVDRLYARLAEIEAARAAGALASAVAPPSESLLEYATAAASGTVDQERPRVFADILFLDGIGEDRDEVIRRFLVEVTSTLTRYEIALLLWHAPKSLAFNVTPFAKRLLTLHSSNPDVGEVRQFSMDRLATFHLLTSADQAAAELTPMGMRLLSAI